jgi:hypothetical protein
MRRQSGKTIRACGMGERRGSMLVFDPLDFLEAAFRVKRVEKTPANPDILSRSLSVVMDSFNSFPAC